MENSLPMENRSEPEPFAFGAYTVRVDSTTTHRPFNSREFIFRVTHRSPDGLLTSVYRAEIDISELDRKISDVLDSRRDTAAYLLRYRRRTHLFDYRSTDEYP